MLNLKSTFVFNNCTLMYGEIYRVVKYNIPQNIEYYKLFLYIKSEWMLTF